MVSILSEVNYLPRMAKDKKEKWQKLLQNLLVLNLTKW